jgi:hypothetical protein
MIPKTTTQKENPIMIHVKKSVPDRELDALKLEYVTLKGRFYGLGYPEPTAEEAIVIGEQLKKVEAFIRQIDPNYFKELDWLIAQETQ